MHEFGLRERRSLASALELVAVKAPSTEALSLSMGMSGDLEAAIRNGATHVRVGSALFEGLDDKQAMSAPADSTLFLTLLDGSGQADTARPPAELPRKGKLIVGSSQERADFVVAGQGIAEVHCAIGRLKTGGWALKDLGSDFGTLLNGERIETARLETGDELLIGSRKLRIVADALAERVAPTAAASKAAPVPRETPQTDAPRAPPEHAGYSIEGLVAARWAASSEPPRRASIARSPSRCWRRSSPATRPSSIASARRPAPPLSSITRTSSRCTTSGRTEASTSCPWSSWMEAPSKLTSPRRAASTGAKPSGSSGTPLLASSTPSPAGSSTGTSSPTT